MLYTNKDLFQLNALNKIHLKENTGQRIDGSKCNELCSQIYPQSFQVMEMFRINCTLY